MQNHSKFIPGVYAGIDLGTVSGRLLIARVAAEGIVEELHGEELRHNIAEDWRHNRELTPKTCEALIDWFKLCSQFFEKHNVNSYRIGATASLRAVKNGPFLVEQVADQAGLQVDIIDHETEVRASALGNMELLQKLGLPAIYVDIGGGSTEVALIDHNLEVSEWVGLKFGSATLATHFEDERGVMSHDLQRQVNDLKTAIQAEVAAWGLDKRVSADYPFILAASSMHVERYRQRLSDERRHEVHGNELSLRELYDLAYPLAEMGPKDRAADPLIGEQSAPLITATSMVMAALTEAFERDRFIVARGPVRHGLVLLAARGEGHTL